MLSVMIMALIPMKHGCMEIGDWFYETSYAIFTTRSKATKRSPPHDVGRWVITRSRGFTRKEAAFVLEAIYKKGGVFKYPKIFHCSNGSEFKNKMKKLLEKHNVDIRRATTKYKHTHTAFVEAFNKELAKLLFKPMDAQELPDPERVSTIWVKNLNKIVKKMNYTVSSMIGIKPKDAIKLDNVLLDKKYPEETVPPEDGLYRYLYQPGEQHGDQKRRVTDLIWS